MYEDLSYESILQRMLDKIPTQYDTREGSVIMNALAPCAMEIYLSYVELEKIVSESFADTQSRDYLILRAGERGLEPIAASSSHWICKFTGATVPIGSRFYADEYTFVVTEQISSETYELECEQTGSGSNSISGEWLPLQYISGLETAEAVELMTMGEEEESTEDFRERYFEFVDAQAFGGNVADYKEKALELDGVGEVKVIPTWDGGGTVKIIFTTSDNARPSTALVAQIQEAFDPSVGGNGLGLAPVGHKCTVVGALTEEIDISFNMSTNTDEDITELIEEAIDEYFAELASKWGNVDYITVRISQIESKLLEVDGVEDIWSTKINSESENLALESDTIAIRGDIDATIA